MFIPQAYFVACISSFDYPVASAIIASPLAAWPNLDLILLLSGSGGEELLGI